MSTGGPVITNARVVQLQHAFQLALSMVLLYWLALWMNWDMPKYGALAIALISLDTTGASLQKGAMRILGTTFGLAVGLLGLSLFAQDSWLTLVYHASYLIFIGYFMQASRYPYAWYVAGFIPSLVWATTYGKVDDAFHYAVFRYLETTAGIVIYTLVCTILWPRQAGDKLNGQGHAFWEELQNLFRLYRGQLDDGQLAPEAPAMRAKLTGTMSQMLSTLQAAYTDTPAVASKKRAWEVFRVNIRAMGDAMELWRQSIGDCRRLDLDRLLPQLRSRLEKLDRRLTRIDELWRSRSARETAADEEDGALPESLRLEVDWTPDANLPHLDRAALASFVHQLNVVELTSRKLLGTMRVLAGLAPIRDIASETLPSDLYQPVRWDPVRLINGLLPAVSFIAAYFFWIYFDPPTGPSVPNMAATFGLSIVLTPMNALKLIPVMLGVMWVIVAPVYFLVMPRLDNGFQLLTLIFGYSFGFALLGARSPGIKTMALVLFVMMTGISNQQSYSFMGLVDGGLMILLALGIIAVVQVLFSPLRPEQAVLNSVRGFFRGCARITSAFALAGPADRIKKRRFRKRHFESLVRPAPRRIQTAQKHLDYKLFPDNSPENVQHLLDSMQSITDRLQALEIIHDRLAARGSQLPESFVLLGSQMRERLQLVFRRWASFEPGDAFEQQQGSLQPLFRDFQQHLDDLKTGSDRDPISDQLLTVLYTTLGSWRGLIEAMAHAQSVINRINWSQWATARF